MANYLSHKYNKLSDDTIGSRDSKQFSSGNRVGITSLHGKTIVWNQLVSKDGEESSRTVNGITFTVNGNGSFTVDGTSTNYADLCIMRNVTSLTGHAELVLGDPGITGLSILDVGFGNGCGAGDIKIVPTEGTYVDKGVYLYIRISPDVTINNVTVYPQVFDLTRMFGSTTAAAEALGVSDFSTTANKTTAIGNFKAMFPRLESDTPYYSYEPGKLVSVSGGEIVWNQLIDDSKVIDKENQGLTITRTDTGTVHVTGTPTTKSWMDIISDCYSITKGHIYIGYSNEFNKTSGSYDVVWAPSVSGGSNVIESDGKVMFTALETSSIVDFMFGNSSTSEAVDTYFRPQLYDLTLMFGAGNEPKTTSEFEEFLETYDLDSYNSYNAGESMTLPLRLKSGYRKGTWNQLHDNSFTTKFHNGSVGSSEFDSSTGTIITTFTGDQTLKATGPGWFAFGGNWSSITRTSHIYLLSLVINSTNIENVRLRIGFDTSWNWCNAVNGNNYFNTILNTERNSIQEIIDFYVYSSVSNCVLTFSNIQLIDLTLLYGAGNEPSTVAEFRAQFPSLYYPYCAGEEIDLGAGLKHVITGNMASNDINKWQASNGSNLISLNNSIALQQCIPFSSFETQIYTFDAVPQIPEGHMMYISFNMYPHQDVSRFFITGAMGNVTLGEDVPAGSNKRYSILVERNSYANMLLDFYFKNVHTTAVYELSDIMVYDVTAMIGSSASSMTTTEFEAFCSQYGIDLTQYQPYQTPTFTTLYPKGISAESQSPAVPILRSAGSVYDEIETIDSRGGLKLTRRVGTVDFDGTEDWALNTNYTNHYFNISNGALNIQEYYPVIDSTTGYICNLYDVAGQIYGEGHSNSGDMKISVWRNTLNNAYACITDSRYTDDLDGFKAYLASMYASGNPVSINYELATPEVTYLPNLYVRVDSDTSTSFAVSDLLALPQFTAGVESGEYYEAKEITLTRKNDIEDLSEIGTTRLPSGYTELEYLESDGNSWIDTEIKLTGSHSTIISLMPTRTVDGNQAFFGARNKVVAFSPDVYWFGQYSDKTWCIRVGNGITSTEIMTLEKHVIELNNNFVKIDGSVLSGFSVASDTNINFSAYLFGIHLNDAGIGATYGYCRIYSCSIYNKDTKTRVRDFIPARRNSDSTLGMYDLVSGRFFTNSGTGTFIAGPDVEIGSVFSRSGYSELTYTADEEINASGLVPYAEISGLEEYGKTTLENPVPSEYQVISEIKEEGLELSATGSQIRTPGDSGVRGWNQLCPDGLKGLIHNCTGNYYQNSDGSYTMICTNNSKGEFRLNSWFGLSGYKDGNKFLYVSKVVDYNSSSDTLSTKSRISTWCGKLSINGTGCYNYELVDDILYEFNIVEGGVTEDDTLAFYFAPFNKSAINLQRYAGESVTFYYMIFDLTAIYGAGNEPNTVDEFRADYPETYYPYHPLEDRAQELHEAKVGLKGNSLVWNQICVNGNTEITKVPTSAYSEFYHDISTPSISNHVYFISGDWKGGEGARYYLSLCGVADYQFTASKTNVYERVEYLITPSKTPIDQYAYQFRMGLLSDDTTNEMGAKNINIIDLTLMFGSGSEPSSVDEFKALFPLDYYPYSEPKFINVQGPKVTWNQLFDLPNVNFDQSRGITWSKDSTAVYANGTHPGTSTGGSSAQKSLTVTAGHKFYINGGFEQDTSYGENNVYFNFVNTSYTDTINHQIYSKHGSIGVVSEGSEARIAYCGIGNGATVTNLAFHPCIVDLTLMFGAGNEPDSAAEFEDFCITHGIDLSVYNEYTTGEEKYLDLGVKSIGRNIWDEEWENGYIEIETGNLYDSSSRIRSKNYIPVKPNTSYWMNTTDTYVDDTIYFDIDKNYIGYDTSRGQGSHQFTTPNNCYYIKFGQWSTYGNVYKNDISIYEVTTSDPCTSPDYAPYQSSSLQYPDSSLCPVTVTHSDGSTEIITGLKKAGSVYDEVSGGKVIQRVGVVDLGTQEWYIQDPNGKGNSFYCYVSDIYIPIKEGSEIDFYTNAGYIPTLDTNQTESCILDYGMSHNNNNALRIYRKDWISGVTANQVKSYMSGVLLYYRLATPITTYITPPILDTYDLGHITLPQLGNSGPSCISSTSIDLYYSGDRAGKVPVSRVSDSELGLWTTYNSLYTPAGSQTISPSATEFTAGTNITTQTPENPWTVSCASDGFEVMAGNKKVVQLVLNGDFSCGSLGWSKTDNLEVGANKNTLILKNTTSGSNDYYYDQDVYMVIGHKYLYSFNQYSEYIPIATGYTRCCFYGEGVDASYNWNTTTNIWENINGIVTCKTNTYNKIRLYCGEHGRVLFKDVMCFDLTEMGCSEVVNSLDDLKVWLGYDTTEDLPYIKSTGPRGRYFNRDLEEKCSWNWGQMVKNGDFSDDLTDWESDGLFTEITDLGLHATTNGLPEYQSLFGSTIRKQVTGHKYFLMSKYKYLAGYESLYLSSSNVVTSTSHIIEDDGYKIAYSIDQAISDRVSYVHAFYSSYLQKDLVNYYLRWIRVYDITALGLEDYLTTNDKCIAFFGKSYEHTASSTGYYRGSSLIAPYSVSPVYSDDFRGIPVSSGGSYIDDSGQRWITDEIDWVSGTYTQRIGKYTFTGSETTLTDYDYCVVFSGIVSGKTKEETATIYVISPEGIVGWANDGGRDLQIGKQEYRYKDSFNVSSKEELAQVLKDRYNAGNPLIVYYPLATPITTALDITGNPRLRQFSETYISGGSGLKAEFKINGSSMIDKVLNTVISGGGNSEKVKSWLWKHPEYWKLLNEYPSAVWSLCEESGKVASITGDGNSWIDTNYTPGTTNTVLSCKFKVNSVDSSYRSVFGTTNQIGGIGLYLSIGGGSFYSSNRNLGTPIIGSTYTSTATILDSTATVSCNSTTVSYNVSSTISDLYLFARNTSEAKGYNSLYYFKVKESGILKYNFIPVSDNGETGLYDLVGGKFYANSGTGSFTFGLE